MQNLEKSLRLLNLPSEMGAINGQINKRTVKSLVELCVMDYTKMVKDPITNKMAPTITYNYAVESTLSSFGMYALNLVANHINWSDMELVSMDGGVFTLFKPFKEIDIKYKADAFGNIVELPEGEEIKSWVGWNEARITPSENGYDYSFYYEQGNNAYFGEYFPHDEDVVWRSILRKTYIKTSSNPNPTRFAKSYPKYTITQLKEKTGLSAHELAEAFAHVWHIEAKDDNTHCLNIASDIVMVDDNTVKGEAFINGVLSSDIPFTTLTSSFGKQLPDFICRYKLYNEEFTTSGDNAYGTAWNKFFYSNQDTTLNLQLGAEVSYDQDTNTLTYPENSKLVFDFEFLPAQAKNETVGCCLDLDTMTKSLW